MKPLAFLNLILLFSSIFIAEGIAVPQESQRKVLVCSTTQVADFAKQIVGDRWEVVCVLGAAEDPHTYEVGADDGLAVARADLCAQNGWNLEGHGWMQKLAESNGKPIVTCVDNAQSIAITEDGNTTKDPHAWHDPTQAMIYVRNLKEAIIDVDPKHADEYESRAQLYIRQLVVLNGWIKKKVNSIPANRRILITHHDAFGYFCNAYGFKAISPVGWTTAELSEVTPEQRQTVVKKIRDIGVKAVFIETSTNQQLIEGIAKEAGVSVGGSLYSDAMGPAGSAAESYIGMMRENVIKIVDALSEE